MSSPFLAEIRLFSFNFAPRYWAQCNGQLLPINQNQALFSLLGTTYGGNGVTTFALPDMRGRAPLHFNGSFPQGAAGGAISHTLSVSELPAHTHIANGSTNTADKRTGTGNTWAASPQSPYLASTGNSTLSPTSLTSTGGSQAHPNEQPYLVLNFAIALQGIFPSRS